MREVTGNIWDYYDKGHWLVLETHGEIRKEGSYIIGKGIDLQAAKKFMKLQWTLGEKIKESGNHCLALMITRVVTFPTREKASDNADLATIRRSCVELIKMKGQIEKYFLDNPDEWSQEKTIFCMTKIGCNDGLDWEEVKSVLEQHLDDSFVVVSTAPKQFTQATKFSETGETAISNFRQFDETILPAFRCPECNKLIEIADESKEYFAVYGNLMLGEAGSLIGGDVSKFGMVKPFRICIDCLPNYLIKAKEKNEIHD